MGELPSWADLPAGEKQRVSLLIAQGARQSKNKRVRGDFDPRQISSYLDARSRGADVSKFDAHLRTSVTALVANARSRTFTLPPEADPNGPAIWSEAPEDTETKTAGDPMTAEALGETGGEETTLRRPEPEPEEPSPSTPSTETAEESGQSSPFFPGAVARSTEPDSLGDAENAARETADPDAAFRVVTEVESTHAVERGRLQSAGVETNDAGAWFRDIMPAEEPPAPKANDNALLLQRLESVRRRTEEVALRNATLRKAAADLRGKLDFAAAQNAKLIHQNAELRGIVESTSRQRVVKAHREPQRYRPVEPPPENETGQRRVPLYAAVPIVLGAAAIAAVVLGYLR